MRLRLLLVAAFGSALLSPIFYNIALYFGWHYGFIAESSIFSLDPGRFFHELLVQKSLFEGGEYTVFPATYFIWYALVGIGSLFVSHITSYLLTVAAFYAFGYWFLVQLLLRVERTTLATVSVTQLVVACAIALLYLSSLSIFNYLKSNIFFALPYLILPALLYCVLRFVRSNEKRFLIPFALTALLLSDLNLAHALILVAFTNVFAVLCLRAESATFYASLKRIALIDICLVPPLLLLAAITVAHALYEGSFASFAAIVTENMYSENARYLNIFAQVTDWGLFGSWQGVPYYKFAAYYAGGKTWAFALMPFCLLAYAAVVSRANATSRRFAAAMLIVACIVFQVMLGNNNIVYNMLYRHIIVFQVFRNISKLEPLLYLVILLAAFVLLGKRLLEPRHFWTCAVLLAAALAYNAPFWSYRGYFFEDRATRIVPDYWMSAGKYLDDHAGANGKVLALPAIYINDIYIWNDRRDWVQGSLLDVLTQKRSYRLSECCIGSLRFQSDARKTFVPDPASVRNLDVDPARLTKLVEKYHLDYVVVSDDLVSEYQTKGEVIGWLAKAGYKRVANFGPVAIYENARYHRPFVEGRGARVQISKINNLNYIVRIHHLAGEAQISVDLPYNVGWSLYPVPARGISSDPWGLREIEMLWRDPYRSGAHAGDNDDVNRWTVSASDVLSKLPAGDYHRNADGSLDVALNLVLRPQAYFMLTMFFGVTLAALVIIGLLIAASIAGEFDAWSVARGFALIAVIAGLSVCAHAISLWHSPDTKAVSEVRAKAALDWMRRSALSADAFRATATSLIFTGSDPVGAPTVWGVKYYSQSKQLQACRGRGTLISNCAPNALGAPLRNVSAFSATPEGNRVLVALTLAGVRATHRLAVGTELANRYPSGLLALPTPGRDVETDSSVIAFVAPGAASKSVHAYLPHDAPYAPYIAPRWSVAGCQGIARVKAEPNATFGGITLVVSAQRVGVCALDVSVHGSARPVVPARLRVTVGSILSWASGGAQTKARVDFAYPSAPPKIMSVTMPPAKRLRLLDGRNDCKGKAQFTVTQAVAGAQATVSISPVAPGLCRAEFAAGDVPPGTPGIALKVLISSALSVRKGSLKDSAVVTFAGVGARPKIVKLYRRYSAISVLPGIVSGNCGSTAGLYAVSGSTPSTPSSVPATGDLKIVPLRAGECAGAIADQHGGGLIHIHILVGHGPHHPHVSERKLQ